MSRTRVMQLISPITMGGAENVVKMLVNNIDRSKFDITVGAFINVKRPFDLFRTELVKAGHRVTIIPMGDSSLIGQTMYLVRAISENEIAILHTHGYRSDVIGYIASRIANIPIMATVHGWTGSTRKLKAYECLDRIILRYFNRIITVSKEIERRLLRAGIEENRIINLNNAINVGAYPEGADGDGFRRELAVGPGVKLIGAIGRLSIEKGLDYFLKAGALIIARDSSVRLVVVGEGPQQAELKALADALGISSSVIFCGYRRDVDRIYPALDIFVLPSLTEGIPIALLEAMAFSRPVIASRVGGVPEVVQDGVTGLLVSPKDLEQLTERMWHLLCSPEAGAEMGRRARKCVESRFNVREWIKKIETIYLDLARQT